jgi:hypothetical protein
MDWWIDGLVDWWIGGLVDWWIDGLVDWWIGGTFKPSTLSTDQLLRGDAVGQMMFGKHNV